VPTIIATAEAVNNGELYATNVAANAHSFIIDEPVDVGGKNVGPSPGDYLCAALASCKAITLRMYANRKGWELDEVKVKARLVKGDSLPSGMNTFLCEVSLTGALDSEQQKRLLEISKACPVQRLLTKPSEVETILV